MERLENATILLINRSVSIMEFLTCRLATIQSQHFRTIQKAELRGMLSNNTTKMWEPQKMVQFWKGKCSAQTCMVQRCSNLKMLGPSEFGFWLILDNFGTFCSRDSVVGLA